MRRIRYRGHISLSDDFSIPITWLSSHALVSGTYRIGGKEFLRRLAREISERYPEIGILYVSQLTKGLEKYYPWDEYYDKSNLKLTLPYFHGSNQDRANVKEWIAAVVRPLGFSRAFEEQFVEYVQGIELPKSLSELFEGFRKIIFESKSISPEDYYLLPHHSAVTKKYRARYSLSPDTAKVEWVEQLASGKNVFLDLVDFWNKSFQFSLILQNLRARIAPDKFFKPQIFIFVEQGAYQLFSRSSVNGIEPVWYNRYMQNVLESFRQRGISLVVEDDQPDELVKSVLELAGLKIFFRLWYPQTKNLLLGEFDLELIKNLPNREAVIYTSQ